MRNKTCAFSRLAVIYQKEESNLDQYILHSINPCNRGYISPTGDLTPVGQPHWAEIIQLAKDQPRKRVD